MERFDLPAEIDDPVPGVLVPCGHSSNGKAAETYQSIAISLARHGMAALVYDPIGQGLVTSLQPRKAIFESPVDPTGEPR